MGNSPRHDSKLGEHNETVPKRTISTLVYVFNPKGQMLLATKKTTNSEFTAALEKVNAAGGKLEGDESIAECALRELEKEFSIVESENHLIPVGRLRFHFITKTKRDQDCYVFQIRNYTGTFKDSTEMVGIGYHDTDKLPYHLMRESDEQRIPDMLAGKQINDIFFHTDEGKVLDRKELTNPDDDTRLLLRPA